MDFFDCLVRSLTRRAIIRSSVDMDGSYCPIRLSTNELFFFVDLMFERSCACLLWRDSNAYFVDLGFVTGRLCTWCFGRFCRAVISNGFTSSNLPNPLLPPLPPAPPPLRTSPLGRDPSDLFAFVFRFPIVELLKCQLWLLIVTSDSTGHSPAA